MVQKKLIIRVDTQLLGTEQATLLDRVSDCPNILYGVTLHGAAFPNILTEALIEYEDGEGLRQAKQKVITDIQNCKGVSGTGTGIIGSELGDLPEKDLTYIIDVNTNSKGDDQKSLADDIYAKLKDHGANRVAICMGVPYNILVFTNTLDENQFILDRLQSIGALAEHLLEEY